MTDRELQDSIISALADAEFRASPGWTERRLADPDSVERFSRFLARHFYYERVVHFFKYSRALARVTGRRPEAVIGSVAFDALMPRVAMGSRRTASEVAGLVAEDQLRADHSGISYFEDLVRYQEAMMVVEAGPRDWSGLDEPIPSILDEGARAEIVKGTSLLELDHDLPMVLPALLAPWNEPPHAPRRPTPLLVARSPGGRVSVVRADPVLVGLVRSADRPSSVRELAERIGVEPSALATMLGDLADVGALRFSTGS